MPDILTNSQFSSDNFQDKCLFTGVPVAKSNGEHVIPKWMMKQYSLFARNFQVAGLTSDAHIKEFRAPAEAKANNDFGKVEQRIKDGSATLDELHLWHHKISVGMMLNHWRLAQNERHPKAPRDFDSRSLALSLISFRAAFKAYQTSLYARNGSTVSLDTALPGGWIVHLFGCVAKHHSENYDALLPYGLLITSHNKKIHISCFEDAFRFDNLFPPVWQQNGFQANTSLLHVSAIVAKVYSECLARLIVDQGMGIAPVELRESIAYELGVKFDDKGEKYRGRLSTDVPPAPVYFFE